MTQITDSKKCTGCQACRLICPTQCITTTEDSEGFQIPNINEARCINCNLCVSRCPENNHTDYTRNNCIKVLGAKLKNDELLRRSASGGVFAGIALKTLETPGSAVFGCGFDDKMVARHIYVTDKSEITPLQSSKYVQSDVSDTYLQAKAFLDDGKTVFYTGTPCQIAGLYAFLDRDYDNLLTADIICHGVPSPLLFKRYINWLGKKHGGTVIYYNFRDKEKNGWGLTIKAKIKTKTKTITKTIESQLDPYLYSFLNCSTFRESCYSCQYANCRRAADITIGDFWGVERYHPEFLDSKGISVVLINSRKGESFFKRVYSGFEIIETTFEKASARNLNLYEPTCRNSLRNKAYNDIYNEATDIFKRTVFKAGAKTKAKAYIKQLAPSIVLKLFKAIKAFKPTRIFPF